MIILRRGSSTRASLFRQEYRNATPKSNISTHEMFSRSPDHMKRICAPCEVHTICDMIQTWTCSLTFPQCFSVQLDTANNGHFQLQRHQFKTAGNCCHLC